MVQRVFGFEDKYGTEFLDSHAQAGLNLEHFHVGNLLRAVVEGNTLTLSPAGKQNLHGKIAEAAYPAAALIVS